MPSTSRSPNDLQLCLVCGDKKVTVNGRSERGRDLITNLLRCLSLAHQFKSNRETLENINLCFKCKYAVEEWADAQEETASGFLANRARQIKAGFLVKILESSHKSSVSSASSVSQRIQQLLYDRFNVSVNVDRLEPSCEQIDQISQQDIIRIRNPCELLDSDTSDGPDDLDRSSAGSSSDVEILEDERHESVEILLTKSRALASANIFDEEGQVNLESNDLDDQERRKNDETNFKLSHPIPPDFSNATPESCSFGKCLIKRVADSFKCSQCSYSIPVTSPLPLWQMRAHLRAQHQDAVPRLSYKRETLMGPVKKIGCDYQYGSCVLKLNSTELTKTKTFRCMSCDKTFVGRSGTNVWRAHVIRCHEESATSLPEPTSSNSFGQAGDLLQFGAAVVEKLTGSLARCCVCRHDLNGELTWRRHVIINHPEFAPLVRSQSVREGLKWKLKLRQEANRKTVGNQSNEGPEQPIKQQPKQHTPRPVQPRFTYSKKPNKVLITKTIDKGFDLERAQDNDEDRPNAVSSSDVEILEAERDEVVEILPRKNPTSRATKLVDECQVIPSEINDPNSNAGQQDDEGDDQAEIIDPVETFKLKHPIPPDFIPDKQKPGTYLYGKCNAMEAENKAKCCECSYSVPIETDGVSSWWKIREHMRNEHPELVPCIPPSGELEIKSIGGDKFQYGKATVTKFLESSLECYKCDICGNEFKTKFARKCSMLHIRTHHPEEAPVSQYFHEKAISVKKNLIRYAAAYLQKLSDTKVMCQVCSFVSTGQHAQKASIFHVRKRHSALAPVEIRAIVQMNSEPGQGSSTTDGKSQAEPDEQAGQDVVDPVETFQLKHPVPPDFIPDKHKPGHYLYGKCNALEAENEAKCCECCFSVPLVTDGVSSWWKIREHMRNEHPELVPGIAPVKDLGMKCIGGDKFQYGQATATKFLESDVECFKCDACGQEFRTKFAKKCCMDHIRSYHPEVAFFNPHFHEKAIFVKKNLIRYAGAYLKKLSDTEVMCQVCSFVSSGQHARKASIFHVRKIHSILAPVPISIISQKNLQPCGSSTSQDLVEKTTNVLSEAVEEESTVDPDEPACSELEPLEVLGNSSIHKKLPQQTLKRRHDVSKQPIQNDKRHTEGTPARPKRKRRLESLKTNTKGRNGSSSDEESSSSDESVDPVQGVFIPNPFRSYGFQCPLCGDRRVEKDNFILHLKWHAGRVDEDSPRQC